MMSKMGNINFYEIARYVCISLVSYLFIFVALWCVVDLFEIDKLYAYAIVYIINYLAIYFLQAGFVFKTKRSWNSLLRYVVSVLLLYLIGNLLYIFFLTKNFQYLISNLMTIIVLFPLRFLIYKFFVHKS